jgi:hypothetical protein
MWPIMLFIFSIIQGCYYIQKRNIKILKFVVPKEQELLAPPPLKTTNSKNKKET